MGVVEHHPDRAFTLLRGIVAGSGHGLHPLSEWALRETPVRFNRLQLLT